MPPISTFSSFKNCWAVRKNSFTISNRSTKLSNLLKISCSWNSHNFGFLSPTKYVWSLALNSLKALRKLLKIFRVTRTLSKASSTSTYIKIVYDKSLKQFAYKSCILTNQILSFLLVIKLPEKEMRDRYIFCRHQSTCYKFLAWWQ